MNSFRWWQNTHSCLVAAIFNTWIYGMGGPNGDVSDFQQRTKSKVQLRPLFIYELETIIFTSENVFFHLLIRCFECFCHCEPSKNKIQANIYLENVYLCTFIETNFVGSFQEKWYITLIDINYTPGGIDPHFAQTWISNKNLEFMDLWWWWGNGSPITDRCDAELMCHFPKYDAWRVHDPRPSRVAWCETSIQSHRHRLGRAPVWYELWRHRMDYLISFIEMKKFKVSKSRWHEMKSMEFSLILSLFSSKLYAHNRKLCPCILHESIATKFTHSGQHI